MKNMLPISHISRRPRRGSVMILVVAVLGLLAVIGTVYVVAARSQRGTSAALSASMNLDLARDAVMGQVQQVIGGAMLDSTGNVGGENKTGTFSNAAGLQASRNYDYPENGAAGPNGYGKSWANISAPDEPWLVAKLHRQNISDFDLTQITLNAFDPSSGSYDLGFSPTSSNMFSVVADQTNSDRIVMNPANPVVDNTTDDPTTGFADAYVNLLPFSDASGIRYRFGLRIIDTNRMANLNTGSVDDSVATGSQSDTTGTYLTSMRLAPAGAWLSPPPTDYYNSLGTDVPSSLHINTFLGRDSGASTLGNGSFHLTNWQTQVLQYERPSDPSVSFFGLSDELELRSYGEFGTTYRARPSNPGPSGTFLMWPNTLGTNPGNHLSTIITGNPARRNYTTYSWSREIRPYGDLTLAEQYTLNGLHTTSTGAQLYPPTYARVPVNLPLNSNPETLAQVATEVATAMKYTTTKDQAGNSLTDSTGHQTFTIDGNVQPFTPEEICAFTANFLTARWNGFVQDTTVGGGVDKAYYLPDGPSLIDSQGICVRAATGTTAAHGEYGNGSGPQDIKVPVAPSGVVVYLGYAAQPFINKVGAFGSAKDTTTLPTITDFAVELYNPYQVALSLNGYQLNIGAVPISLTGHYVPANGCLVIAHGTAGQYSSLSSVPSSPLPTSPNVPMQVWITNQVPAGGTGGTITLYRPYAVRGQTSPTSLAQVDSMNYGTLIAVNIFPTTAQSEFFGRDNVSLADPWGCAFDPGSIRPAETTAFGQLDGGTVAGRPLYDRFAGTTDFPANTQALTLPQVGFANVAEFNRTMRVCNEINGGGLPAGNGLVVQHLENMPATTGAFAHMQFPADSEIYFDFRPHPEIYNFSPPGEEPGSVPMPEGDIRASRFLDQLAFIDRVSDTTINVSGDPTTGPTDINKIRLPGQINVNTASGDVLRALPGIQAATPNSDAMVAYILAYRDRKSTGVTYGTFTTGTTVDYTQYAGRGYRSLAELIIPISDAEKANITSIPTRDKYWASIYNLCTVRSDTFAVYGYLEAVKQNPAYNPASFHNNTDWYRTAADPAYALPNLPIDNPHNTGPLIRVACRRWIAIVDRSFCNYPRSSATFALPRVVAIKDLPQ